jgi:hypothetical protein
VVRTGNQMNPTDGVTIYCPHRDCKNEDGTPCQEVTGHGGNEKEAWYTIQCKYVARDERK